MRHLLLLPLAIFCLQSAPAGAQRTRGGPVVVTPEEDTTRALRLPDAGLQSRMWSRPRDDYVTRANILYARFTWKGWGLRGEKKIPHFKHWMARKRFVALRMYCNSPADLPEGLTVPIASDGGRKVPMYWHPDYLAAHRDFVRAVGKELADNPYLSYVDIGGVGNTGGEWIIKGNFKTAGLDREAQDRMVWETVKMYREAFPHVRLYLAAERPRRYVKDRDALYAYMKRNNIGFRLDGLCGHTYAKDDWARRAGIHELWQEFPFQWEGAYATMEWERNGWDTAKVMDAAMGYGPTSICYADADQDAVRFEKDPAKAAILDKAGLKLGYRIAITKAAFPGSVSPGGRFRVVMHVANRGCARVYADRELEFSFLASDGRPRVRVTIQPSPPTSQWEPGKTILVVAEVTVPQNAPSGEFILAVAMLDEDPRRPNSRIEMAMKKKTPDNLYWLDRITIGGRVYSSRLASRSARARPSAPLAPYAKAVAACRALARAGQVARAVDKARGLAREASDESVRSVLEALARGLESAHQLRRIIVSRCGEKRPTVYVDFAGRIQRARIVRAGGEGVVASVQGAEVALPWQKLTPRRFLGIAAKFARDDAAEHLWLAGYAAALGLREQAEERLGKVLALDAARQKDVTPLWTLLKAFPAEG